MIGAFFYYLLVEFFTNLFDITKILDRILKFPLTIRSVCGIIILVRFYSLHNFVQNKDHSQNGR